MAGTNPIIDLATINDLQTRLAAIEAALGKYNSANAVTAATGIGTAAAVPSGGKDYIPTTGRIESGKFIVSGAFKNTRNGVATGTASVIFSKPFSSTPIVVASPLSTDPSNGNLPTEIAISIGNVTNLGFQVRITRIGSATQFNANILYIAVLPDAQ